MAENVNVDTPVTQEKETEEARRRVFSIPIIRRAKKYFCARAKRDKHL
jgi:hypothetical protein